MIADTPSRQLGVRVPTDTVDELDRIGTARNQTRAELIRDAVELYVTVNRSAALDRAARDFVAAAAAMKLSADETERLLVQTFERSRR